MEKQKPVVEIPPGTPHTNKYGVRLWPQVGDMVYPSSYPPHAGRVIDVKPYRDDTVTHDRVDRGYRTVRIRRPNGTEMDVWCPYCLEFYVKRKQAQHKRAAALLNSVAQVTT